MFGSIPLALFIAACIISQVKVNAQDPDTSGETSACDDSACTACPTDDTAFCTQCDVNFGVYLDQSTHTCIPCHETCYQCTSATKCDLCASAGTGPDKSKTDGSCASCGDFCTICDVSGSGKCDETGCTPKYAYNTTTTTCQPCKGAECPGCDVPDTCPTCVDGTGLDSTTGKKPQEGCKKCAVPHASICTGDYKKYVFCQNEYYPNYDANTCDPICATIGKDEWSGKRMKTCPATLVHQVQYLVIHHTRSDYCFTQADCTNNVKALQKKAMDAPTAGYGLPDMLYHFLIGEDGNIYVGRNTTCCGFTYDKTKAKYNCHSYDIGFLGTFTMRPPGKLALDALLRFVSTTQTSKYKISCVDAKHGDLKPDWKLVVHSDLGCTNCPGGKFQKKLVEMFGSPNKPEYASYDISGRYTPTPFCKDGKSETHPVK